VLAELSPGGLCGGGARPVRRAGRAGRARPAAVAARPWRWRSAPPAGDRGACPAHGAGRARCLPCRLPAASAARCPAPRWRSRPSGRDRVPPPGAPPAGRPAGGRPDLGVVLRSSRRHLGQRVDLPQPELNVPPASPPPARQLEITPFAPALPAAPAAPAGNLIAATRTCSSAGPPPAPADWWPGRRLGRAGQPRGLPPAPRPHLDGHRRLTGPRPCRSHPPRPLPHRGGAARPGGERARAAGDAGRAGSGGPRHQHAAAGSVRRGELDESLLGAHLLSLIARDLLRGCRDGNLYGLGCATGASAAARRGRGSAIPAPPAPRRRRDHRRGSPRCASGRSWRARLGGKVVSSPATSIRPRHGLVVIGSRPSWRAGAADGAVR
jgi:hypothetical protein